MALTIKGFLAQEPFLICLFRFSKVIIRVLNTHLNALTVFLINLEKLIRTSIYKKNDLVQLPDTLI